MSVTALMFLDISGRGSVISECPRRQHSVSVPLAQRGFSSGQEQGETHKPCLVKAVGIFQCLIIDWADSYFLGSANWFL